MTSLPFSGPASPAPPSPPADEMVSATAVELRRRPGQRSSGQESTEAAADRCRARHGSLNNSKKVFPFLMREVEEN